MFFITYHRQVNLSVNDTTPQKLVLGGGIYFIFTSFHW
jgi:hypothetical protein